jgi:signal transduction histidine kinase
VKRTSLKPSTTEPDRGPLELGVEVLLRGGDPIPSALEALRVAVGARCAAWSEGPGKLTVSLAGRREPTHELPSAVPGRWLMADLAEGRRRIPATALARDPRARAAGLIDALVQRTGRGRLWLDAQSPLRLPSHGGEDLLSSIERLAELREQLRELRASTTLAIRGERAAGVAHDLRNQLALALLEFEQLRAQGLEAEHLAATLERARAISEQFLSPAAAAPTTGLAEWLTEEVAAAARLAARGEEVRVLARSRAPQGARTEEQSFRRVVMNLTLNAIHATPSSGCVRVELRAEEGYLELEVHDQGRGMSTSEREELFRPGASRGGTGFGTSSVQDCVEALAGELTVVSAPGAGTSIRVRWPAS